MDNHDERPEDPQGPVHPEHVPTPEEAPDDIAMLQEAVFGPSASEVAAARNIFREGLVPAAESIAHLAAFSKNDRIRLDASKYVVERNLGKMSEKLALGDVWENLFAEISAKTEEE